MNVKHVALGSVVLGVALWTAAVSTVTTPDQQPVPHHALFASAAGCFALVELVMGAGTMFLGRRGVRGATAVGLFTCASATFGSIVGILLMSGKG